MFSENFQNKLNEISEIIEVHIRKENLDWEVYKNIKASFQVSRRKKEIYIFDTKIPLTEGDKIIQTLQSGVEQEYIIQGKIEQQSKISAQVVHYK